MNIPQFWAKASAEEYDSNGKAIRAESWGWSDSSDGEARDRAKDRARRVVRRLAAGEVLGNSYEYDDRPIKEERIREVESNVITRTGYGSLVLNCPDTMFIDVDVPQAKSGGLFQTLRGLFGKKQPAQPDAAIERLKEFQRSNRQWSFRVYATHSGFRYLVTHARQDPNDSGLLRVMDALGTDPLYMKLCKSQKCFRARVSPKPWRCGLTSPNVRFPFPDEGRRKVFELWKADYDSFSNEYATARFIESVGDRVDSGLRSTIELHDSMCKTSSALPLA